MGYSKTPRSGTWSVNKRLSPHISTQQKRLLESAWPLGADPDCSAVSTSLGGEVAKQMPSTLGRLEARSILKPPFTRLPVCQALD